MAGHRSAAVFGLRHGCDVLLVDWAPGGSLHADQVVATRDRDRVFAERDLQRAPAQLWERRRTRGVAQDVHVAGGSRELPERRTREHLCGDRTLLRAGVEDASVEIVEGSREPIEVLGVGRRDEIDVVCHSDVSVDLDGDTPHHDVVDLTRVEGREDGFGVERPWPLTIEGMTIQRMDHVGVVVDDLPAAIEFFLALGLELEGEAAVGGAWVDRVIGLEGVQADIAMLQTPDGNGRVELSRFRSPSHPGEEVQAPANAPGIRHLSFAVEDVDAIVERLRGHGAELVGRVERYKDIYRLCYVRGPAGIIVELAERLG
jgi:catechol 2,3-dioxygenase-like lactoylglutathione lyase family enzyme